MESGEKMTYPHPKGMDAFPESFETFVVSVRFVLRSYFSSSYVVVTEAQVERTHFNGTIVLSRAAFWGDDLREGLPGHGFFGGLDVGAMSVETFRGQICCLVE
jgi:hypothetical protein